MFKIYNNQGFQITFGNGLTVSVMFGSGHYCSNHGNPKFDKDNNLPTNVMYCENAEVYVFSNKEIDPDDLREKTGIKYEDPYQYVTTDELFKICNKIKRYKTKK